MLGSSEDLINYLMIIFKKYYKNGEFNDALECANHILKIIRDTEGENTEKFADYLKLKVATYESKKEYSKALQEILKIKEIQDNNNTLKKNSEKYLSTLEWLSKLYNVLEDYDKAEQYLMSALAIYGNRLGEKFSFFDIALNHLGNMYKQKNNLRKAISCYDKLKEIRYNNLDKTDKKYIDILIKLGELYSQIGELYLSSKYYKEIIEISNKSNIGSPLLSDIMNSLAILYDNLNDFDDAEHFYTESLNIRRETFGEKSEEYAQSLNNLGQLYSKTKRLDLAESYLIKSFEIMKEKKSVGLATILNDLGVVYFKLKKYELSEYKYKEAKEIRKSLFDKNPQDYTQSLYNLAVLYIFTKRYDDAFLLFEEGMQIEDSLISKVFAIGIDSTMMNYMQMQNVFIYAFLTLIFQHFTSSSIAVQKAFYLVLKRKGMVGEILSMMKKVTDSDNIDPNIKEKIKERDALRKQIRSIAISVTDNEGFSSNYKIDKLANKLLALEKEISIHIPEDDFHKALNDISLDKIPNLLPAESILIEFFKTAIFDFEDLDAYGHPKLKTYIYLAFIIRSGKPEDVQMLHFEADVIDKQIPTFIKSITNPLDEEETIENALSKRKDLIKKEGNLLSSLLFKPFLNEIGSNKRLLISPDSNISLLPFEVLPINDGIEKRLIDEYYISYLNTARDLLRQNERTNRIFNNPIIAGNPDFNLIDERSSKKIDMQNLLFAPLNGMNEGVEKIAAMLKVKPLLNRNVLKTIIMNLNSPYILHITTHGFFIDTGYTGENIASKLPQNMLDARKLINNPLYNSGLALAGANSYLQDCLLPDEAGNGIINADDIGDMNLSGTELVVLSACDTALGFIINGEGVFGLQRTFVLSGVNTLVMSLWQVPAEQTNALMINFYERLILGEPRGEALRNSQIAIKEKNPDPINWGAFICQGNTDPLSMEFLKNKA